MTLRCALAMLMAWWLAGCTVSPQPLPPEIEVAALRLETSGPGRVRLRGAADSVHGARLRVTNLGTAAPPSDVTVAADGSFEVELDGALADVLRLQAIEGDARSALLDVTGTADGAPVAIAPVPAPCLSLDPPDELAGAPVDLADPVQILVATARNDCPDDVTIADIPFRAAQPEFVLLVAGQLPRVLTPGEDWDIEIGFKSMTSGAFEEVALVTLEAPGGPIRAITVRGTTR